MTRQAAPFTDDELKEKAERLIEKWAPRLGLLNWHFVVVVEDSGGEWSMCGSRPTHFAKVIIRIDNKAENPEIEFGDETFEHNMVHELSHFLVAPIRDVICDELDGRGAFFARYANSEDTVVDALAHMVIRIAAQAEPRVYIDASKIPVGAWAR